MKLDENKFSSEVKTQTNKNQVFEIKSAIKEKVLDQPRDTPLDLNEVRPSEVLTTESSSTVKDEQVSSNKNDNKNKRLNESQKHHKKEVSSNRLKLLNKLLERSIQHERNTIFQCITYIAKNNFFD